MFAIYVGGELRGANIELHDMRFIAAASIDETHDELRRQWWGIPESLHIDCWAEISYADGYDVALRPEPFAGPEHLYYVNLGGYIPSEFGEKHHSVFVVATSVAAAKKRALATVSGWSALHLDDLYEAEQAFAINGHSGEHQLHLHLRATKIPKPTVFKCQYKPIGKGV